MSLFDDIILRLSKYPNVKYSLQSSSITIFPESVNGFEVRLDEQNEKYTVYFEGWHEEFEDGDEALNCLAFGLSKECRIKEFVRGGVSYKWIVESNEHGKWKPYSETGLFVYPFWKNLEVRYRQNSLF